MEVDRVAAAGVVDVPRAVVGEPVVGRVVDPAEAQRRPPLAALGGVVEHDVEDHLDSGRMQGADHSAELVHLAADLAARGVLVVRREVADRLVAPVVAQSTGDELGVVDELMDREQLHRGDAEPLEV